MDPISLDELNKKQKIKNATRITTLIIAFCVYALFTMAGGLVWFAIVYSAVMGETLDTVSRCYVLYYLLMQGMFWIGVWFTNETCWVGRAKDE